MVDILRRQQDYDDDYVGVKGVCLKCQLDSRWLNSWNLKNSSKFEKDFSYIKSIK